MSNLQPRPLAALSSALLARKGHARPAMRPQGFGGFGAPQPVHEDLGWNDMGDERSETVAAEPAPVPPVLVQREALREEFEAPAAVEQPVAEVVSDHTMPASGTAPLDPAPAASGRKAAFTLRLDADRHVRLRLASATRRRSAQQLVTEALDTFLATLPEVEELARQLPHRATDDPLGGIR